MYKGEVMVAMVAIFKIAGENNIFFFIYQNKQNQYSIYHSYHSYHMKNIDIN
jgi:hypothetical protein